MLNLGHVLDAICPWRAPPRRKVVAMPYGLPEAKPQRPTIRVLMLRDERGCPDGFTPTTYKAGQIYELPEDLAGCFFSCGAADPAEAHGQPSAALSRPAEGAENVPESVPGPANQKGRYRPRQGRREAR